MSRPLTNDVVNHQALRWIKTIPIIVYPDTYHVPFVVPSSETLQQSHEYSLNQLYRSTGIEKAVRQSIADYINGIATGEPIKHFF